MQSVISDKTYRHLSVLILFLTLAILIVANFFFTRPHNIGEWDDFALVSVSIINDGNTTISEADIAMAEKIFPAWHEAIGQYRLSGYYTANGDELSWYYPTFSFLCVPILKLFLLLNIDATYTFACTNILLYMCSLVFVFCYSRYQAKIKFLLLVTLCANPIIIYTAWISGEVFMFSFLVISLVLWDRKKFPMSALCLSIASTLNPTILMAGFILIIDFFHEYAKEFGFHNIFKHIKKVILLAVSFIPGLLPFMWNYYNTGHINLTAAAETDHSLINVFQRFHAYLWDLNLGVFPYYNILFLLFIMGLLLSVWKRKMKPLFWGIAFLSVCLAYSLEIHINCGMSGIARYSSWACVFMIFAVFSFHEQLSFQSKSRVYLEKSIFLSSIITTFMVCSILLTNPIGYLEMTPLSKCILDSAPQLYNPMPEIFNARVNHVDEIYYKQNLPIVYCNDEGQIRKILIAQENSAFLLSNIEGSESAKNWLAERLNSITGSKDIYISVTDKYPLFWQTNMNSQPK